MFGLMFCFWMSSVLYWCAGLTWLNTEWWLVFVPSVIFFRYLESLQYHEHGGD
jgi:hypothetical protein